MAQAKTIRLRHSPKNAYRSLDYNTARSGFSKIILRKGLLTKSKDPAQLIFDVLGKPLPPSIVVITDSTVARLQDSRELVRGISQKIKSDVIVLPAGEKSKTLDQCSKILSRLSSLGLERDGAIILLGGGVVGDIGGFVASIYKRGVRYIQIPTTLLAQVDSSIGGKTGVDTLWGKNQVGTFYQPNGVLIDPDFLKTLPSRDILNGIGEIVKYGVVASEGIFSRVENFRDFETVTEALVNLVEPCCRIKARIVSIDEFDRGVRSTLNYGHTIGHAFEAESNYNLGHGACVLLGMICEGYIANKQGIFHGKDYMRQQELIARIFAKKSIARKQKSGDRIVDFARGDKKNIGGELRMSLPEKIGKMYKANGGSYKVPVSQELLRASLEHLREVIPSSR